MKMPLPPMKKPGFSLDLSKAQKHEENRQDPTNEGPSNTEQATNLLEEQKSKSPIPSLKLGAVDE